MSAQNNTSDRLLTQQEVADLLRVSERMVRKLLGQRQIASVKVGQLVRIRASAVAEYLERQTREAQS